MFCLLACSPLAIACRIFDSGITCLSPRLTFSATGAGMDFLSGFCSITGAGVAAAAGDGVNASTSF